MTDLNKEQIKNLLPHREPMLLIDELINIKKLKSATAIVNVKKDSFFVNGHFPGQPVMPGVLIVESFGQAAAALTAHGLDKSTYENKLVFLMGVEKARFRNPVIPDCKLILKIEKEPKKVKDCFKNLNRATFAFNQSLDKAIIKPLAESYRKLPDPLQKGTHNFVTNLSSLVTIPNNVLQGDYKQAGINTGRFIINTII